jgi:diguanylate cyclase (GGDEF)-like protein
MKLKYTLFLSIFALSLILLGIAFLFESRRDQEHRSEAVEERFAAGMSALAELEAHSDDSLRQAAGILAMHPLWAGVNAGNEKDMVGPALRDFQRQASLEIVFYSGPDNTARAGAWTDQRWTLEELRSALAGVLQRSGDSKRKANLFAMQGRVYQASMAPVTMSGQVGRVGVAAPVPFGNILRAAAGLDSSVSGNEGRWADTTFALGGEDALKLTNLSGEEIESVQLSNGAYYARAMKLDPERQALRVALLLPRGSVPSGNEKNSAFALLLLAALLGSAGAAWALSLFISEPLALLAKAAGESAGSPSSVPALFAARKDEVGLVSTAFNQMARSLGDELKLKEKALSKLEKYQLQLLDLNHRLAKKLYENRVMLSLWKEQEKAEDTKNFLSHILEEILQGLPFHYGCIIIRPLAQIGPEVILARIERTRSGKEEISVTDILERSDRTLWLSSLSPELKNFLLKTNQEGSNNLKVLQEVVTASIEPETPVKKLTVVSLGLAQGKQHMGSLHLIAEAERFSLSASEEEFLESVAAQVSVALDNRSLQYSTRVDPLTRLYNRGYMNDRLREEMLRSSRTSHPFTLLLLDIDHFKKVNDTYGHPAGDEVLVGLSSLLKRSCRASDALCRYGGEEIALILVDTSLSGAKTFAENIRKTIASETFSIPDGKTIRVTVSMGFAEFPSQAGSMAELVKRADEALYQAKREGRNGWRAFSA